MLYDASGREIVPPGIGFVPTRPTKAAPQLVGEYRADAVSSQQIELEPDEDE